MRPVRVLLVDDQVPLRRALRTVLSADPGIEVVGDVGDGRAAIEAVRSQGVDVVLMDIRMPGLDGVGATKEVTRLSPTTRVLILTTFDADELVAAAVRAGASGYLTKDTRPNALRKAVHDVAAGTSALAPGVAATVIDLLREAPRAEPRTSAEPLGALSPREVDVFMLIAAGRSNTEIGEELFLSQNTVKTHVRAVLTKLGLRDRVHVVIHAYEHGLIQRPPG
ncbi:response regulator transcription factor [Nocardiopsis baichengensis]|uniref:response regulator transcription factor n=1 Tax=Nocardiopsis baichengensis TaxID=280240 RepID=UPI00034B272F